MSPPTGNDCRPATATKGPSRRKISPASGRRSRGAGDFVPGWSEGPALDVQLHIEVSRDSGFDASHRPGMTLGWPRATAARAARGGTAMDAKGQQSGHLMLISPERVFYAGLLGRPRKRTSGGYNIYVAMRGSLAITEGKSGLVGELAVVPPYVPHSVESQHPCIICLVIEPETVEPSAMEDLSARIAGTGAPDIARRIRVAYETLRLQQGRRGFTSGEFDQLCFGEALPDRRLDRRIKRSAAKLNDFSASKMTAADCAASAGLSPSRFLHLFKEQTG